MAERIDKLSTHRKTRASIYPWGEWMDGHAWRITRGEDFTVNPQVMAAMIRGRAASQGVTATTRVEGEHVEFQFTVEAAA